VNSWLPRFLGRLRGLNRQGRVAPKSAPPQVDQFAAIREELIPIIEKMATSPDFDESTYNEFYDSYNKLTGSRGLFGVAADEMTEYYACWRYSGKNILPSDEEAIEIRENLRLLAEALRTNVTSFRSFEQLRTLLELRPK
jgi:hypothetical protein